MKRSPDSFFIFLLAISTTFTTILASQSFTDTTSSASLEATPTSDESSRATPTPTPDVIEKCQDIPPVRSIRLIVALAMVSVLHMPGSLILPKRSRFYRLAPEVALIDLIATLMAILQSVVRHKRPLRGAITAVLICRYYTSKEEPWWDKPEYQNNGPTAPPSTSGHHEPLKEVLEHFQAFGPARVLYNTLAIAAVAEAFTVKGPLDLTLLVVLYTIPLFTLELVALAALQLNPSRSIMELKEEVTTCANFIAEFQKPPPTVDQGTFRQRFCTTGCVAVCILFGIPAALSLLYPFSVPGFILFTFTEWHSANGKWWISWLTWVAWLVCLLALYLSLVIIAWLPACIMARPFPRLRGRYCEKRDRLVASLFSYIFSERTSRVVLADIYTALKILIVARHFAVKHLDFMLL